MVECLGAVRSRQASRHVLALPPLAPPPAALPDLTMAPVLTQQRAMWQHDFWDSAMLCDAAGPVQQQTAAPAPQQQQQQQAMERPDGEVAQQQALEEPAAEPAQPSSSDDEGDNCAQEGASPSETTTVAVSVPKYKTTPVCQVRRAASSAAVCCGGPQVDAFRPAARPRQECFCMPSDSMRSGRPRRAACRRQQRHDAAWSPS